MKNTLKSISKTEDEFRVANYIILFGGKDVVGEFFTEKTKIESSYTKSGVLHVDFEHGLDHENLNLDENEIYGYVDWKTARTDERGVFVERVLNRHAKYMEHIEDLIEAGVMGTSSQAIEGKAKRAKSGEIVEWQLMRDSLTVQPAEPRMITENALKAAKSLLEFYPNCKSLKKLARENYVDLESVKSSLEAINSINDLEAFLREAGGFSKGLAVAVVARTKTILLGEPKGSLDEKTVTELKRLLNLPSL